MGESIPPADSGRGGMMADNTILLDAFKLKPAAAIEFLNRKGYALTKNWFGLWKDAHAKAFTVSKVAKIDLLRDIRGMVEKAVADGITLQQFKKELIPQLDKHGWWGKKQGVNKETGEVTEYTVGPRRLKTIYQTNLHTSYMAGRYKGQMEAAADLPYLQYIAVMDGKTTDRCREMDGRIFRADDPVWDALYPPNHWGCRARVRSLTEKQVERMGGRVESSEGRIVESEATVGKGENAQRVKTTGLKLPSGETFWAGPGWDYNPGKEAWMPDLDVYHPADAKAFIRDGFDGPAYKRFLDAKGAIGGVIPIAVLSDEYVKALGAKNSIIRLSSYNYWKNDNKHPDISLSDLQQLQLHLDEAEIAAIVPDENREDALVLFNRINGKIYKTAIKTTIDKDEVYFLSMHRGREANIRGALQKATKIIRGKI